MAEPVKPPSGIVYQCDICLRHASKEQAEKEGWHAIQRANAPDGVLYVRCNQHEPEKTPAKKPKGKKKEAGDDAEQ